MSVVGCGEETDVDSVGSVGCCVECTSTSPLLHIMAFTSPVLILSFASIPITMRLPSSIHLSSSVSKSLM